MDSTQQPRLIKHCDIDLAGSPSVRADGLDQATVDGYAALKRDGVEFKPGEMFEVVEADGSITLLEVEGGHRRAADALNGLTESLYYVRRGTRGEAFDAAFASNADHGLRRSSADTRYVIRQALAAHPSWSERRLADLCRCDPGTVKSVIKSEGIERPAMVEGANGRWQPSRKAVAAEVPDESLSWEQAERLGELEASIEVGRRPAEAVWLAMKDKAALLGKSLHEVFDEYRPDGIPAAEWLSTWTAWSLLMEGFTTEVPDLMPPGCDFERHAYVFQDGEVTVEVTPSQEHPGFTHVVCLCVEPDERGDCIFSTRRPIRSSEYPSALSHCVPERHWDRLRTGEWQEYAAGEFEAPLTARLRRLEAEEAAA